MGAIKTAADAAIVDSVPVDKAALRGTFDLIDDAVADIVADISNVDNTSDANKPVSTATATALALKAPLASPTLTGTPAAPTAAGGTNTTQVATTAFVTAAVAPKAPTASPTFTGVPAGPTAAPGTNTTQLATTAFSAAAIAALTKASVGLSNVDNTTDANKPVSIATASALSLKATIASPELTGVPTAPTAAEDTNTDQIATCTFVLNQGYQTVVDATAALDDEIADRAAADTTLQDNIDLKAALASPHFSGVPTAPTAAEDTNTDQIATCTFVLNQGYQTVTDAVADLSAEAASRAAADSTLQTNINLKAALASPHFTGMPTAPTAAVDTNTDQLATCTFVLAQSYLKADQTITLSGDVSGSGSGGGGITVTLDTVNDTVGTFQGFTVNAKGLVTHAVDQGYALQTAVDLLPTYTDPDRTRPENSAAFSSALTGADRAVITNGSAQVHSALGAIWRLTGDDAVGGYQDIAPRTEIAVEAGRVYRARASFIRSIDPVDPSGHAVEFRMQNLNQNRASVSNVAIHDFGSVVIADGIQDYSFTFSRAAGADYTNPSTTRYAVPFLRVYGDAHEIDIAVIDVEDITEEAAGDAALAASVAAETAARIAADNAEITTRAAAITTEAGARAAADSAEATARAAADSAEATSRAAADTTLQTNIDTEEAARIAADIELDKPETLLVAGKTKPMRAVLRVPVTSGLLFDTAEITTDADGALLALRDSAGLRHDIPPFSETKRYPAASGDASKQAFFGGIDEAGQFAGIAASGQLVASIEAAYSRMGRAPQLAQAPDVWRITTDQDGNATIGEAYGGAPISYISRPTVATEWLASNGTVVAPFTASSRECVVAYVPGTGRVVLTPYSDYHFLNPALAYGDKCVIAWRYADGDNRSTAKAFAIAIDGTGDMVPEDPNVLSVFLSDGQSLAVGSHGVDEYPWLSNSWPEHTLVLDNTTIPGDVRLGRDADDAAFVLDGGTLGGFTAMLPQGGDPANEGFTPLEGLVFSLQDKIVRKFGRPQRMCVAALGVAGTAIADLDVGSANRTNLGTAIDAIVTAADAEGWTVDFTAYLWIQGESDAVSLAADYQAAFETQVADVRALCLAAAGTQPRALVWSWSSFGEAADDEQTGLGGELGQMAAYLDDPDTIKMVGPHYPLQAYYYDFVHFLAGGYLRLGETAAYTVLREVWGLGGAEPLYALAAVYSGAGPTVTITWSRPIVRDATLVPVRDYDGIEVAYASGTFKAIVSHVITPNSATSVVTLESTLTGPQLATAKLQIGLKGQANPRDVDNVPGTNIRAYSGAYDRSEYDGKPYYHFAVHQRLALT